jgi:hypothetical protein
MNPLRVFIGFDSRESEAYEVARFSLLSHASVPISVIPLRLDRNEEWGLLDRPWRIRDNRMFDVMSDAACSTEFANSRFLAVMLTQIGWSLFVDPDVVFLDDVAKLFALADPTKALMCVQHPSLPTCGVKMDGQAQQPYARKNWSSVMLINADHHGNHRLNLAMLNKAPGRDLHALCWLWDNEIGALPSTWNWLVGVQERPQAAQLAHLTLGGPWLPNWSGGPADELWRDYADRLAQTRSQINGGVRNG